MGEIVTVVGGSGSAIAVTLDGAQAIQLAQQFRDDLQNHYASSTLNIFDLAADQFSEPADGFLSEATLTVGGEYKINHNYDYIAVGGLNNGWDITNPNQNPTFLNEAVTLRSALGQDAYTRVLQGSNQNVTYVAGSESGEYAAGNSTSAVRFEGNTVSGGDWNIATGSADDTIISGSGNNTISAGTGKNTITLGEGNNNVTSDGQDTITGPSINAGRNQITLNGGSSQVDIAGGATNIFDNSSYNTITVGGGSTIVGNARGNYGNYNVNGQNDPNATTEFQAVTDSTITATNGAVKVIQGSNNSVNANNSDVQFFNGTGNTTVTGNGVFAGFGANDLNITLNASDKSGLFVGGNGNETLDASASSISQQIYANTIVGASSSFVAIGGAGDDILAAGNGNSTFTGGAGNNQFLFSKNADNDGTGSTVITDFAKSEGNKLWLNGYGLDENGLNQLLKNSQNDAKGDAVLNLDGGSKITLEGVSVSQLNASKFTLS